MASVINDVFLNIQYLNLHQEMGGTQILFIFKRKRYSQVTCLKREDKISLNELLIELQR